MQTFLEYLVNFLEVQIDFELHYFAFEGGIEQICSKLVSTLANTLAIIAVHNKRVNRIGCQGFLAAVGLPFNTNSPSIAFSYSLFSSVKEVRVHGDIKRPNYYSIYLSVVQLYSIYKVEEAALFPGCSGARALNRSNQSLYKYACERLCRNGCRIQWTPQLKCNGFYSADIFIRPIFYLFQVENETPPPPSHRRICC